MECKHRILAIKRFLNKYSWHYTIIALLVVLRTYIGFIHGENLLTSVAQSTIFMTVSSIILILLYNKQVLLTILLTVNVLLLCLLTVGTNRVEVLTGHLAIFFAILTVKDKVISYKPSTKIMLSSITGMIIEILYYMSLNNINSLQTVLIGLAIYLAGFVGLIVYETVKKKNKKQNM